ncbi:MAG: hypothetical protein WAQ24_03065 [Candidatus Saccharimonadales bacterium]
MKLRFLAKAEKAKGVWEFTFAPEQPVHYIAGQYARFSFPFAIADPRGKQYRTFTLTSHPSENEIRFLARLEPPLSAFKTLLSTLTVGDAMHIDEPMGDAVLPRSSQTPLVFVAQGIALASYLSILHERERCARSDLAHVRERSDLSHSSHGEIVLVWVRRGEDDRLESLIPGKIPHLRRIDIHYPLHATTEVILPMLSKDSLVYLSGSQVFVETLGAELEAAGVPRARLMYDYYSGYADL